MTKGLMARATISLDLSGFLVLLFLGSDLFLERQVFLATFRLALCFAHVTLVGRHFRRLVGGQFFRFLLSERKRRDSQQDK